jgi:hypothetical protein
MVYHYVEMYAGNAVSPVNLNVSYANGGQYTALRSTEMGVGFPLGRATMTVDLLSSAPDAVSITADTARGMFRTEEKPSGYTGAPILELWVVNVACSVRFVAIVR